MISSPTVFVLGAGASRPFGFPTGQELRTMICRMLRSSSSAQSRVLTACGHDTDALRAFADEFEKSSFHSIDRFLAMRPSLEYLGRQVIVACLSEFQLEQMLYCTATDANGSRVGGTSDWYGHVFNVMVDGAFSANEVVTENKVAFITFNYDLSLERFLLNGLTHGYGIDVKDAEELVARIPIHHMYGSLALPEKAFHYAPGLTPPQLKVVAESLRVLPHARPEIDEWCMPVLAEARNIFFLGFGFDEMNCQRLGIVRSRKAARDRAKAQTVYATAYAMTESETDVASVRLGTYPEPYMVNKDCLGLLRNFAAQLSG